MENAKSFFQTLLTLLVIALIGYNIYTGATVQKIGIPGLFEIEFGAPPRTPTPVQPTSPPPKNDAVGIGIAGSNDHVYVWYKDGTVSSGSSSDLDQYREPYPYSMD